MRLFVTIFVLLSVVVGVGAIGGFDIFLEEKNVSVAQTENDKHALVESIYFYPSKKEYITNESIRFHVKNPSDDIRNYEYAFWVKGDLDWEKVIDYTDFPIRDFKPNRKNLYDIQIDIRDKDEMQRVQKIYLGQFVYKDKIRKNTRTINLNDIVNDNSTLDLSLSKEDTLKFIYKPKNNCKLKLWVKKNNGNWIVLENESSIDLFFTLDSVGTYAFQADMICDTIINSYSLGSITVLSDELIAGVTHLPMAITLTTDQNISFYVTPSNKYNINDLEYSILVFREGVWKTYQDYSSLPIKDFSTLEEGGLDLQINIREKENTFVEQKIWINRFSFFNYKNDKLSLYRTLLANNYYIKNQEELADKMSYDLYVVVKLLYLKEKKIDWGECLTHLVNDDLLQSAIYKDNIVTIITKNNIKYQYDVLSGIVKFEGDNLLLKLDDSFSKYENVFKQFAHLNERQILSIALFYSIYDGFDYGTDVSKTSNLKSIVAHCGSLSSHVHDLFIQLGKDVSFVGLDGVDRKHLLVELNDGGNKFLLDPSNGYVYENSINGIICKNEEINLKIVPQKRKLDYLYLENYFNEDVDLWVSTSKVSSANNRFIVDKYIVKDGEKICE